ncbi:hypothetical protein C0214_02245 [Methylobacterium sp. DM1]|nr:hypothetical protein C0214_02245 [Methylobacterium sp. DM1]
MGPRRRRRRIGAHRGGDPSRWGHDSGPGEDRPRPVRVRPQPLYSMMTLSRRRSRSRWKRA